MENAQRHLKAGLICATLSVFVFTSLGIIGWACGEGILLDVSAVILIPLSKFWEFMGISGCQAMGHLVFIILSIPVYYFILGFVIGFPFSALIEVIDIIKEHKPNHSEGAD